MILDQNLAEQERTLPLAQRQQAAKEIGGKYGLRSGLLGVLSIQAFATLYYSLGGLWAESFDWLNEGRLTIFLLISIIAIVVLNYAYGRRAGQEILINRRNHGLVGIITSFVTLISGSVMLAILVTIGEGGEFELLYLVPFLITLGGAIPAIVGGALTGYFIHLQGRKQQLI